MGPRRVNYTEREKQLMRNLVKKYPDVADNSLLKGADLERKHRAWAAITQEFNAQAETGIRDTKQLRNLYDNLKRTDIKAPEPPHDYNEEPSKRYSYTSYTDSKAELSTILTISEGEPSNSSLSLFTAEAQDLLPSGRGFSDPLTVADPALIYRNVRPIKPKNSNHPYNQAISSHKRNTIHQKYMLAKLRNIQLDNRKKQLEIIKLKLEIENLKC